MRILLSALILSAGLTTAHSGDFRLYPGFQKPNSFVQMTNDKGLTVEIMLRCKREGKRPVAGIMVYSKIDKMYCSSKWLCTKDVQEAANDTCGY